MACEGQIQLTEYAHSIVEKHLTQENRMNAEETINLIRDLGFSLERINFLKFS